MLCIDISLQYHYKYAMYPSHPNDVFTFVIYGRIERILMDIYMEQMTYILRKRNKILKFLQGDLSKSFT